MVLAGKKAKGLPSAIPQKQFIIIIITEIGNYGSFFDLLPRLPPSHPTTTRNPKIRIRKIRKNEQNCWRYRFTHVHQKPQSHEVRFLRYGMRQTEIFVIFGYFLPFYPPNIPENQNFEKMKKASGDVIILHLRAKNHNYMMYAS